MFLAGPANDGYAGDFFNRLDTGPVGKDVLQLLDLYSKFSPSCRHEGNLRYWSHPPSPILNSRPCWDTRKAADPKTYSMPAVDFFSSQRQSLPFVALAAISSQKHPKSSHKILKY